MTEFFRFPHTTHLAWLGEGRPRSDKVLDPSEMRTLLAHEVVVEEKVDGANLGFSVDEKGEIRAQNRGRYLVLDETPGQFRSLKTWLQCRKVELADALFPELMLFGEWCYSMHSIEYTRLPDWFLMFDVYDRTRAMFWSAERRNALAAQLGLAVVPCLGMGTFDLAGLTALLSKSRLTDGPAEGVYVRQDAGGCLVRRAKLVRPEFVQAIDVHWSKKPPKTNSLRDRRQP